MPAPIYVHGYSETFFVLDLVSDTLQANRPVDIQKETSKNENQVISSGRSSKPDGRMFQFCELAAATMNFKDDHCLGEGAFGNVYKGRLESTNQEKPHIKMIWIPVMMYAMNLDFSQLTSKSESVCKLVEFPIPDGRTTLSGSKPIYLGSLEMFCR